ncbi:MAG: hypothetical protein HY725_04180 [Candidatus Rokubacteria bacterium]|nr:hypothetical protein [Candidatus Rokubacteria bacterium]
MRRAAVGFGCLVFVALPVWWFWAELLAEIPSLRPFRVALALTCILLLALLVGCWTGFLWPWRPQANPLPLDQWADVAQVVGARATIIALFIGVLGGALAWGSLKASLAPFQPTPGVVRAEGKVVLIHADPGQSSATVLIRTIGRGRVRITDVGVYVEYIEVDGKKRKEKELFSFPLNMDMSGDSVRAIPGEGFQQVFRAKLRDVFLLADPRRIERVTAEPRYEDIMGTGRTPSGGNKHGLELEKR